jgi:lipoprotein-anchoring transpeptidase ErfK/SrfK
MKQTKFSRRRLLQLSGSLLATAPFINIVSPVFAGQSDPIIEPARRPFGRSIQAGIAVRDLPGTDAKLVRRLTLNEVIAIKGQTSNDNSPTEYNKIWYQTDDGYVYSAFIQPADNVLNKPIDSVSSDGFWGEITVPVTEARGGPGAAFYVGYHYYYGCIFKVIASKADKDGNTWYQISDEYSGNGLHVRAEHMRRVPEDEFTPLAPDVPAENKHIDVDVTKQLVTAYEGDTPVFTARVATGATFRLSNGTMQYFRTIPGEHRIYSKTPSQHMVGGTAGDTDYYDLPGIGWCSYFTASGIAFHGTYWHNDYGKPRSHGCVNMLPEDAKWIFRWTLPTFPYSERTIRTAKATDGTLVKVF